LATTVKKRDHGSVPLLPEKLTDAFDFDRRQLSSPIFTGERAKIQLEAKEKRKKELERQIKEKLSDEEVCDDYDEDLDEGYHQYMAM
jgi:hypothetical protein